MSAIPMLLLYAQPVVPLLRSLPSSLIRWIVGPLLRFNPLRRIAHWLVSPAIAWLAMNIAYLCWHIPAAYNFALENETVHGAEHLCFLFTSLLFWWTILSPWPAAPRPNDWGAIIYLALSDVVMTMLSGFLSFCDRPVYSFYVEHPNPFPSRSSTIRSSAPSSCGSSAHSLSSSPLCSSPSACSPRDAALSTNRVPHPFALLRKGWSSGAPFMPRSLRHGWVIVCCSKRLAVAYSVVCHSVAQRRNLLLPLFSGGSRGHKEALATELDGPLHFVFVLSRNCLDRCLYRWQSVLSFFPTPQPPDSAAPQSPRLQPPSHLQPSAIAAESVPSPPRPAFPC